MKMEDYLNNLQVCLGTLDLKSYGTKDILLRPIPSLRIKIKLECLRNKKEGTKYSLSLDRIQWIDSLKFPNKNKITVKFDKSTCPKNSIHTFNVDVDIGNLLDQWITSKIPEEINHKGDALYKLAEIYLGYIQMFDKPPDFDDEALFILSQIVDKSKELIRLLNKNMAKMFEEPGFHEPTPISLRKQKKKKNKNATSYSDEVVLAYPCYLDEITKLKTVRICHLEVNTVYVTLPLQTFVAYPTYQRSLGDMNSVSIRSFLNKRIIQKSHSASKNVSTNRDQRSGKFKSDVHYAGICQSQINNTISDKSNETSSQGSSPYRSIKSEDSSKTSTRPGKFSFLRFWSSTKEPQNWDNRKQMEDSSERKQMTNSPVERTSLWDFFKRSTFKNTGQQDG
ncbi:unnamed protein product [Hymenolepis diminuta]|uniref:Autophagy-related protein 13 n=1 Tax=Hymenolepis diminuta TaxID=6216 RepID=A0A0R3SYD4_HYMDI|nr:unnamed protein product [Hymenolepis diminuta]